MIARGTSTEGEGKSSEGMTIPHTPTHWGSPQWGEGNQMGLGVPTTPQHHPRFLLVPVRAPRSTPAAFSGLSMCSPAPSSQPGLIPSPGAGRSSCLAHPETSRQRVPPRKSHLPSPAKHCACQMHGSCGHSSSGEEPEHSTGRESHVKNALLPS